MTPARFRWGVFLVLLGLLLLLRNFDVLNDNFVVDLIILFPVVLIAVGIEKIFAKTKLRAISYLTTLALFIGGLAIAFYGSYGGEGASFFSRTTYIQETDPEVRLIRAELDLDETDLTIRDSGDDLIYGRFDRFTRKPDISVDRVGETAHIHLTSRSGSFLGGAVKIETDDDQDWFVRFARDVPLEIDCNGYKSDLHLNMATTPLRRLDLDADEADVYLKLGELEPLVRVSIFGDETDLRLRIPRTVGVKVFGREYHTYLSTIGLAERDDGFVNEGFDTLTNKIEIKLGDRLGSFSVDFF